MSLLALLGGAHLLARAEDIELRLAAAEAREKERTPHG